MNNPQLIRISQAAVKALYYEVALTPKPGLVDRFDNGAHQDMDFFTFIDSINSLAPFFQRYATSGFDHQGDLESLFQKLREIGKEAEIAMLKATHGVNTHKGANFSFAVILGATGYYLQEHSLPLTPVDSREILQLVAALSQSAMKKDLAQLTGKNDLTHGEELFRQKGITGVRGQAAQGYPAISDCLLPFLRSRARQQSDRELTLLAGLVLLMAEIEDSNVIHRGGLGAWQEHKEKCRQLHQMETSGTVFRKQLSAYNQELIEKNLSPGGAADLLSLGIYFSLLEELL